MTNDRLRDEAGDLSLVPPEDRVAGPGTTPIMAAFTHLNTEGSRFTDGSFGVFYAGLTIETAIAETKHHRINFLAATDEPRSEEHTSELQSLMRISYAVFCLKTKNKEPQIY